jgi:DNA-binding MarR family transcriptional regulator
MQPYPAPAPPTLSPQALAAWHAFLQAHTVVTRALEREMMASQRLPLAEYDVLFQLSAAPEGRLRMAQLADQVLLSRSGLTRLVERLEGAGLVHREVCPSDARGAYAVLTDRGRARLEAAMAEHLRSIQEHFGDVLDCQQMESLRAALQQLVTANLSAPGSTCPGDGVTSPNPMEDG